MIVYQLFDITNWYCSNPKRFISQYKHEQNRTFLAWLHVVVMLAGASVTIVTFSKAQGIAEQLFGIVLLPVSVAYIIFALSQCKLIVLKVLCCML